MFTDNNPGNDLNCFFVSDLHGNRRRYEKLFDAVADELPQLVFIGGDLLPGPTIARALDFGRENFVPGYLAESLRALREKTGAAYPEIFVILGNDDGKHAEKSILDTAAEGLWHYVDNRKVEISSFVLYGYSYIPPSPFQLKDWERYDVSRHVDPGCVAPEDGIFSVSVSAEEVRYSTIQEDLEQLAQLDDLARAVFLFHAPPYRSSLDRADLEGIRIDHVPLDVHLGSIAIRRFIESRQPLLTLHGHVHESARLTGKWKQKWGKTWMFSAAHDGPELALVRFSLGRLEKATRELL